MVLGHRLSRIHSDSSAKTEASTSTFQQRARRMSNAAASKKPAAAGSTSASGCGSGNNTVYRTSSSPSMGSSSVGAGANTPPPPAGNGISNGTSPSTSSSSSTKGGPRLMKIPSNTFSSSSSNGSNRSSTSTTSASSSSSSQLMTSSSSFGRIHRVDSIDSVGCCTSSASSEGGSTPRSGSCALIKRNVFGVKYAFNKRIKDERAIREAENSNSKLIQTQVIISGHSNSNSTVGDGNQQQQLKKPTTPETADMNRQFHSAKERTTAEYQRLWSQRHKHGGGATDGLDNSCKLGSPEEFQAQYSAANWRARLCSPRRVVLQQRDQQLDLFQLAATKHGQRCAILSFLKEALRYHKTQIRGLEDELRVYRLGEVVNRLAEKVSTKMSTKLIILDHNGAHNRGALRRYNPTARRFVSHPSSMNNSTDDDDADYSSFPQPLSNECWRMVLESHLYQRNVLEKAERALFQPDF